MMNLLLLSLLFIKKYLFVATCSTDAVELVTSLGADVAIDYKTQNIQEELSNMEKYDFMCNKLC
jgi:NADPH:quinone reductase-like Zn-dependent oxidoreductase